MGTRRVRAAAVLALGSVLVAAAPASADTATPTKRDLVVQAHRGGPALGSPENTVALFQKAVLTTGVDRIETDIHWTADGELVLIHDRTLPASCTQAGAVVRSLTWAQLSEVRCSDEPIPRLVDLLDVVRGTGVGVNLELKKDLGLSAKQYAAFARQIVKTVKAAKLPTDQVVYSSFYWRDYGKAITSEDPKRRLIAMESGSRTGPKDQTYTSVRLARDYGVDVFQLNASSVNEGLASFIEDLGMTLGTMYQAARSQTRYALAHRAWTFNSDDPVAKRRSLDELVDSLADEPLKLARTTTEVSPRTVLPKTSLKKGSRSFVTVFGKEGTGLLPTSALTQYDGVQLEVTAKGEGTLDLAAAGSRTGEDGVRTRLTTKSKTWTTFVPAGDGGRVRIRTTGPATVTLTLTGFRTASY